METQSSWDAMVLPSIRGLSFWRAGCYLEKINDKKVTKSATKKTTQKTDLESEKKPVKLKSKLKRPVANQKTKSISKKTIKK